jgi:ABC-type multidrug transport system fused ATPase/permease subunit
MVEGVLPFKKKPLSEEITFRATIEFKNVSLYYDGKPIVEGIDIVIRRGESIAIVGCNGSGKSTFIRSLLGFTKYTGDILIDGINIESISNRSVLRLISYISQDDYTSDCTVLDNIRLGNARCTREDVESKAKLFGANEAFLQLENGYETMAGVGGSRLSAGQRQKISLVRAAVRDAPILILDEATAAIDKRHERRVLDTILNGLAKKTVLMIINDKSYLKSFDRVFFFSRGRLSCTGSYKDLMSTSQDFRQFVSSC